MRLRHIVICGLLRSTKFFHIISNGTIILKKITKQKISVWMFLNVWRNERDMIKT